MKPNNILCTESRVTDKLINSEYDIDGYTSVVCFSQTRATGSVLAYIKNSIKYRIISNDFLEKKLWYLSIEIRDCAISGIYTVIYKSPAYSPSATFEYIDKLNLKKIST